MYILLDILIHLRKQLLFTSWLSINWDHTYSSIYCLSSYQNVLEICLYLQSYPSGWQTVAWGPKSAICFVNTDLLEHSHIHIYALSMAAFVLQELGRVVTTDTQ